MDFWQFTNHRQLKVTMLVSSSRELVSTSSYRAGLRTEKNVRFIDRSEYCNMLVSSRELVRCDISVARIRGIYDPELELRFLIEEELLFPN